MLLQTLDWQLTRPQPQPWKLTYSLLMYLMSAFEPPLCAPVLVFRVKRDKLVFTFCWVQQYWTSVVFEYLSHRRLRKTEARIDYKWNSFKLQIYGITEYCQEDVPIENVQVEKKKKKRRSCMYFQEMCHWGVSLRGGCYSVISRCNWKGWRQMRGVALARILIKKPWLHCI